MKRALFLATAALTLIASAAAAQPRYDPPRDDQRREEQPRGDQPRFDPSRDGRARHSITLYGRPDFDGRPFQTFSEITNLPKQFNDRAMSLRIEGRRAWQVCSNSDFKGHCEVFDHDVTDLRQFGLGGQVSSMRPVR